MRHRNGDSMLPEGHRFPRLMAPGPAAKLAETIAMPRLT
jgi:hypothetical protein